MMMPGEVRSELRNLALVVRQVVVERDQLKSALLAQRRLEDDLRSEIAFLRSMLEKSKECVR
jgi:hypothetical protein